MFDNFRDAQIGHFNFEKASGSAVETVLPRAAFADALAEITSWEGYAPTPLHHLGALATRLGLGDILYKDEAPRFGLGSFKALGGAYAGLRVVQRELTRTLKRPVDSAEIRSGRLSTEISKITLVSATDGNHGRSLSWGAQRFGAPCRIYIHKEVSEGRAKAMRDLGAIVTRIDGDYDASVELARSDAEVNGWHVVSDTSWEGYSQPPRDVMAGYGVMVNEIIEQANTPPTHVFLQGGVGGLAAGVVAGLCQHWGDEDLRVVIVEPDLAACLFESARQGTPTSVQIAEETVMAGLSCGEPSELAWAILREAASDFVTIPDEIVAPAVRLLGRPLADDPAIIAGESAVAGLAALIAATQNHVLATALGLTPESRVLLIGSEGATDPEIYEQIMSTAE